MNRTTREKTKETSGLINNLQWKYDSLGEFYASNKVVEDMKEQLERLEACYNAASSSSSRSSFSEDDDEVCA